jgi:hypothetical protein
MLCTNKESIRIGKETFLAMIRIWSASLSTLEPTCHAIAIPPEKRVAVLVRQEKVDFPLAGLVIRAH